MIAESPMLGAKVPQDWQQQIQEIAHAAGRKEAEVVREALTKYLGKTDPGSVKGALAALDNRLADVERLLASFGRLFG